MATNEQDKKRLKEILAASALTIRIRVERFIERAKSPEVVAEIEAALLRGDTTAAMSIVQSQLETVRPAVTEAFLQAGNHAADEAATNGFASSAAEAGGLGGGGATADTGAGGFMARIGIVFDPTNPRAAEIVRKETEFFLKDLTATQVETTRTALANAFDKGLGPRATAAAIRDSIGLTNYQMGIVDNYEAALRANSSRALNYQLRNQARDGIVDRAVTTSSPLTEKQITTMVDAYRNNFLRYRAETIARTESTTVTSLAREETYYQITAKLGIGHNRLIRTWNDTEDDRTRDWHSSMHGQEAALGQAFVDGLGNSLMYPGDRDAPAETVVCCRCGLTYRIAN